MKRTEISIEFFKDHNDKKTIVTDYKNTIFFSLVLFSAPSNWNTISVARKNSCITGPILILSLLNIFVLYFEPILYFNILFSSLLRLLMSIHVLLKLVKNG
jgi:hypothetical protein